MRENCTYGSMRDILRAEGESQSDALAEVRAFPTGRPALLYTLLHPLKWPAREYGLAFGAHQAKPSAEARFTGLTENCYTTKQSQESTCLKGNMQ